MPAKQEPSPIFSISQSSVSSAVSGRGSESEALPPSRECAPAVGGSPPIESFQANQRPSLRRCDPVVGRRRIDESPRLAPPQRRVVAAGAQQLVVRALLDDVATV